MSITRSLVSGAAVIAGVLGWSPAELSAAPRLIVVVSVDQWAYHYFDRLQDRFGPRGLVKMVRQEGAWYSECHHAQALTYTAPGHAVLMTGCYPNKHGIVDNNYFDRRLNMLVYCVADPGARLIGAEVDDLPVSPKMLLSETVGDRLKEVSEGKSKVFGVAIKDRASILMCGKRADAAYWMSEDGWWITTSAYRQDLPGYLRQLNDKRYLQEYAEKTWELSRPATEYAHGAEEDSYGERPVNEMGPRFPHQLPPLDSPYFVLQLACSPFGNEVTLRTALAVIAEEQLGQDEHPDILNINLSSNDYVGHSFGPESLEAEDMTYRTDEMLGAWVRRVDEMLPQVPWTLYVTADHGVCSIPERLAHDGQKAARVAWGGVDPRGSFENVRMYLEANLRHDLQLDNKRPPLVQAVVEGQVYFTANHPELAGDRYLKAQQICQTALRKIPEIEQVYTRDELLQEGPKDPVPTALALSLHTERGGDVLFVLKPLHIYGTSGTTHGSPWEYDTHVPLMIRERAADAPPTVKPGVFGDRVSPAALAATIAAQLQIPSPQDAVEPALGAIVAPDTSAAGQQNGAGQ